MGTKVIIYHYIESLIDENFSEKKKPVVLSKIAEEFSQTSPILFKDCGGLKIADYFKDSKTHIRISFWRSAGDYKRWLQHQKNSLYLKKRTAYQIENQIVELLEGPFEAKLYD